VRHLLCPYEVEVVEGEDGSDLLIYRVSRSDLKRPSIPAQGQFAANNNRNLEYLGGRSVEMSSDLIRECSKILEGVLYPQVGLRYSIVTRLPFGYHMIPSGVRDRFLRNHKLDTDLSRHLAVEKARMALIHSLDQIGLRLLRKKPPSVLITHDIETEKGLRRATALKSVEDELGIQSIWFLPSDEYPITRRIAAELAEGSVIGSHDVKHDGKLIHIGKLADATRRLRESKIRLEEIFEQSIVCFRSPLLQFSLKIASALKEAGYCCDFSVPCWEPIHPSTMSGFGIESTQSFEIEGVIETPLTLFQDHQVLYLLGMNVDRAVNLWLEQAKLIRSFDGDIVLLIHPDYAFSRALVAYRKLLISLLEMRVNHVSDRLPTAS
jgi:hypothetical protein